MIALTWMLDPRFIPLLVFLALVFSLISLLYNDKKTTRLVGLDHTGVFVEIRAQRYELTFTHYGRWRLLAHYSHKENITKEQAIKGKVSKLQALMCAKWRLFCQRPQYLVIYRDALPQDAYRRLQSFAAQQVLLASSTSKTHKPY